jgi:ankyrin repeat protein
MAEDSNLLIKAVKAGDIVVCMRLLELEEGGGDCVVDIHEKDRNGSSPIIWASQKGFVDIVKLLLSKCANIHDKDMLGDSPIIKASMQGHDDIVQLLLSQGANIHDKNNNGWSPIIYATYYRGHVDIVELLLSKGANIHDKNRNGWSPIIAASANGSVATVQLLLSQGANVHDTTNYGSTSLSKTSNDQVKSALLKWPTTMGVIMLQELGIIFIIDSESVIDLNQYI